MSQKRVLPDIYKTKRRKTCINETKESFCNDNVADAKSALKTLRALFPVEAFQNRLPAIIMKHQIYSFIIDRTEVDKQLNDLRNAGLIRMFKLGEDDDDIAVVFLEDYFKHIKAMHKGNSIAANFLCNVVDKCPDLSFDKKTLLEKYNIGDKEIRELIQGGLLTVRDIGSWWLAIPGAGEFVSNFSKGRQSILGTLRRAKYREIRYQELLERKLGKKSKLGMQYHIHDVIGADLVTVFDTSSGKVIRLRESE